MIEIQSISGKAILPYLPEAARLRIAVFREFPYLYDGSEAYEREYLEVYAHSERSVFILALKDGRIIGMSTGLPLAEADEAFRKPFVDAGWDPQEIFYFGESVVAENERGQGIGHRFFDEREKHAAAHGFPITTFCAVQRPDNHPMKPAGYRTNDAFWTKRGYEKRPDLHAELDWPQVDQKDGEVRNRLVFWLKAQK